MVKKRFVGTEAPYGPVVITFGDGNWAEIRRGRRGAPVKMVRRALAQAAQESGGFPALVPEFR